MTTYYVRYNVEHKKGLSPFIWKVFESEDKYWLTNSVKINVPTWSGTSTVENGDTKYSMFCTGTMTKISNEEIIIDV